MRCLNAYVALLACALGGCARESDDAIHTDGADATSDATSDGSPTPDAAPIDEDSGTDSTSDADALTADADVVDPDAGRDGGVVPECWSAVSPMNVIRAEHGMARLADGRVLAVGGHSTSDNRTTGSSEVYDPATDTWSMSGEMITRRNEVEEMTVLADGSVLISGGHDHDACCDALTSAEIYDPGPGSWRATDPMEFRRGEHRPVRLLSGRVLVVGGFDWGTETAPRPAEVFDPTDETWTTVGEFAEPGLMNVAIRLDDGRVLVKGDHFSAAVYVFDPEDGEFERVADMLSPRYRPSLSLLPNGGVLAAGGRVSEGERTATTEIYDPATGTWTEGAPMATPRMRHTATVLTDGRVLVTGSRGGASLAETELYDPTNDRWMSAGRMNVGRESHAAVLLDDGRVLVTGGWPSPGTFGTFGSAEVFDPACLE